jgi:hypothetical protein
MHIAGKTMHFPPAACTYIAHRDNKQLRVSALVKEIFPENGSA